MNSHHKKWFRLYADFAKDVTIQLLSEQDQRRYIMCLCLRCEAQPWPLGNREIAWALHISEKDWIATQQRFIEQGLFDPTGDIPSWDKHSLPSDTSNARVARYRDKIKSAMPVGQGKTTLVKSTLTAGKGIIDDLSGSKEPAKSSPSSPTGTSGTEPQGFVRFWDSWPKNIRKGGRSLCLKAWLRCHAENAVEQILAHVNFLKNSEEWKRDGGQYVPAPSTYLNQQRWSGSEFDFKDSPRQIPEFKLEQGHYLRLSNNDNWIRVAFADVPESFRLNTASDRETVSKRYRKNNDHFEILDAKTGWKHIHQYQVPDWLLNKLHSQEDSQPSLFSGSLFHEL